MRAGSLIAAGPLGEVITSENVSACFDVPVTVGRDDGRWWSRAVSP
jgi:iron complex transport system ATP-binding protein